MTVNEIRDGVVAMQMAMPMSMRSRQIREAINWLYEAGAEPCVEVNRPLWKHVDSAGRFQYPDVPVDIWRLNIGSIRDYMFEDDILRFTCTVRGQAVEMTIPTIFITTVGAYGLAQLPTPVVTDVDVDVFVSKYLSGTTPEQPIEPPAKTTRPTLRVVK